MNQHRLVAILLVLLFILLSVALPLSVGAQVASAPARINPCTGQAAQTPNYSLSGFAASAPFTYSCAPIPSANSTAPTIKVNSGGLTAWWYCKRPNGTWRLQFGAAAASAAAVPSGAELWGAATSANPLTAANALATRYANTPIESPALTAAWCPHWPAMMAGLPAATVTPPAPPAPPAAVWKTSWTLAFKLNGSNIGAYVGTVAKGLTCDPASIVKIGGQWYGTWAGAPNRQTVTVCAK